MESLFYIESPRQNSKVNLFLFGVNIIIENRKLETITIAKRIKLIRLIESGKTFKQASE